MQADADCINSTDEIVPERTIDGLGVGEWLDRTQAYIEGLAVAHGWDWDDGDGYRRWGWSASTRSRYAVFSREREDPDEDEDSPDRTEYQTLRVRLSDHPTAYCSEDVSICPDPSLDDHTLGDLARIFARPFAADH